MTGIDKIIKEVYKSPAFTELKNSFNKSVSCINVSGSLSSFIISFLKNETTSKKLVVLSSDNERVSRLKDDITLLDDAEVSIFNPDEKIESDELSRSLTALTESNSYIVLLSYDCLSRKVISKSKYKESIIEIKKNSEIAFDELLSKLQKFNFLRKDFVEGIGDFSVRGGIVDLFAESYDTPLRIEFFGDTIESIREFDITTQRSIREIESVKIGMNLQVDDPFIDSEKMNLEKTDSLISYVSDDTVFVYDEPSLWLESWENEEANLLKKYNSIEISSLGISTISETSQINFNSQSQPDFHSNLKLLYNDLSKKIQSGNEVYILCSDNYQAKRIKSLIEDFEDRSISEQDDKFHSNEVYDEISIPVSSKISGRFEVIPDSLHSGFVLSAQNLVVYTEHQIFGRFFRQLKKRKKKFKGLSLAELKELKYGDYIVHRDFGIGIFNGLKKITVSGSEQEVVKIAYEGGDSVFLNLNYIHLIKKYSSTEGYVPKLTKLGGGEWDKIKERAKKKVKDIARDLILLYAKRKSEKGYKFGDETHWQRELEANFMYEDTPDQLKASNDVKDDMESETPMDRLVCGDVGFGKTEVAVRAAFKAVQDNKQAAVLVPTTILAIQHYNTFRDRLAPFAVEVDVITRLQSKKQQAKTLERLAEGKVNILIGTHRILSKDISFKDLGLLVIDEEQRFGVKAKEKLRAIKPNVDTLTLTATPIPRTLNFSLLGARDLSIINTPPKNRKPIHTEIIKMDWNNIGSIINDELKRNGQVYFVNDRIGKLEDISNTIKEYVPSAKTGIAHGQMDAGELEDIIVNFIEKKLNVLVCTKIIESGLDIPNVNTIIINNAEMYGLSELYQLRGRVGRSEQQAYAYLISSKGKLTKGALKRLQAIEEFTELGSGINLAMRDMEIRGVGNLLGKEQSGFVQQIGFDMFMSVIEEAVTELKENEFKELFKDEKSNASPQTIIKKEREPAVIENDINALIPKDYIENETERLNIYRRLYEASSEDELNEIRIELTDRFGEFLEDVENLFKVIKLKIDATKLGLEKIQINKEYAVIYFPKDKNSEAYESEYFKKLIEAISADKGRKINIISDKERLVLEYKLDSRDDNERLKKLFEIINL